MGLSKMPSRAKDAFKALPGPLSNLKSVGDRVPCLRVIGDSNAQVGVLFAQRNFIDRASRATESEHISIWLMYQVSSQPSFDERAPVPK